MRVESNASESNDSGYAAFISSHTRLSTIAPSLEMVVFLGQNGIVPRVPLFRPEAELEFCGEAVSRAWERVLASGTYVNGPECRRFEDACAEWIGVPFAVGVSSGTMALELMLRAAGVGKSSEVVTTAHTFAALAEAVLAVGAKPRFVDIDPVTWQMPASDWRSDYAMVCHMYGGAAPAATATARALYEDASQSFGGWLNGTRLGAHGYASAVSLYPTKNLSALGDAGVVLTGDEDLAEKVRALRNHGQTARQVHEYCGTTGRLDELQAAILSEKLKSLETFLELRRFAAEVYQEGLAGLPLAMPTQPEGCEAAPNLFVVRTPQRAKLQEYLRVQGIETGIHYPTPIHRMPAYREQSWASVSLPNTERLCSEILTLPLWVGITRQKQMCVIEAIRRFFDIKEMQAAESQRKGPAGSR